MYPGLENLKIFTYLIFSCAVTAKEQVQIPASAGDLVAEMGLSSCRCCVSWLISLLPCTLAKIQSTSFTFPAQIVKMALLLKGMCQFKNRHMQLAPSLCLHLRNLYLTCKKKTDTSQLQFYFVFYRPFVTEFHKHKLQTLRFQLFVSYTSFGFVPLCIVKPLMLDS